MGSLGGPGAQNNSTHRLFCIGDLKENITNVDFNILKMGSDRSKINAPAARGRAKAPADFSRPESPLLKFTPWSSKPEIE